MGMKTIEITIVRETRVKITKVRMKTQANKVTKMLAKEQNRTRANNKASIKDGTYLNNPTILLRIGEESFKFLATKKSAYTNRVRVRLHLLPLITEPLFPEIIATISGSHPIRNSGFHLYDTATEPPIIHSHQATTYIDRWLQGDRNVFLSIMESSTGVQRGEIVWSVNDAIGIILPVTILGGRALLYSTISQGYLIPPTGSCRFMMKQ